MRRVIAVGAILASLIAMSGCGADNKDPRYGRVVTDESSCVLGSCYTNWVVCAGPDLIIHIEDDDFGDKIIPRAKECVGNIGANR